MAGFPFPDAPATHEIPGLILLVPGFPADEHDSTCIPPLQNFVHCLSRKYPGKIEAVIAFQYPFRRGKYNWNGVPVWSAGGRNRRGIFRLFTWFRVIHFYFAATSGGKTGCIHAFWLGECAFIGRLLIRFSRKKLVVSLMGQDSAAPTWYKFFLKSKNIILTAPSEFAAGTYRRATGREVSAVVPFGLAGSDAFQETSLPLKRTVDILGVGSLIPLKNFDQFVQIVAVLRERFPEIRAEIIGAGPERAKLQRRIREKTLQSHLRLTGELPRPEVLRRMRRSKILLHPSRFEAQGYVFMEALAAGMAVIARNVGYLPDHPAVQRCGNEPEMAFIAAEFLKNRTEKPPPVLPTMAETVSVFASLYQQSRR